MFCCFVFYKTKIKKTASININYYIEYIDVDLYDYFLIENFEDTSINYGRSDVSDLTGLFVDKEFIYIIDTNNDYLKVDKNNLKLYELKPNDSVIIKDKSIIVEDINFTTPFWYLVFN